MPVRLEMVIEVEGARDMRADRVHAAMTNWFEDEVSHHAPVKGFCLSPWRPVDDHSGVLDVAIVDDPLIPVVVAGVVRHAKHRGPWCEDLVAGLAALDPRLPMAVAAEATALRALDSNGSAAGRAEPTSFALGTHKHRVPALVREVRVLAASTWEELSSLDEPRVEFTLLCASPLLFRSGRRNLPEPVASRLFGSWRRAWRAACPDTEPQVGFHDVGLATTVADGRLERYQAHGLVVDGFVGWARVETGALDRDEAVALGRLAALAPFVNAGSNATVGMGVVVDHGPW